MVRQIIIINGPKGAGKDTAAGMVSDIMGPHLVEHLKMSDPVKEGAHALHNLAVPVDYFENIKDVPQPAFHGLTPRAVYIDYSNRLFDTFGPNVLYNIASTKLSALAPEKAVVLLDAGIQREVDPLFARKDVSVEAVIRMRSTSTNYEGDIRSDVSHPAGRNIDLDNSQSTDQLRDRIASIISESQLLSNIRETLQQKKSVTPGPQTLGSQAAAYR